MLMDRRIQTDWLVLARFYQSWKSSALAGVWCILVKLALRLVVRSVSWRMLPGVWSYLGVASGAGENV